MDKPQRGLRRQLRKVFGTHADNEAETLEQSVDNAVISIKDAIPRTRVRLRGHITQVIVESPETKKWLEAELTDSTSQVALIWMGYRSIVGINEGTQLIVEGMLAKVDGRQAIFNPSYTIIA